MGTARPTVLCQPTSGVLNSLRNILLEIRFTNHLDGEMNEGELLSFISMVKAGLENWNNGVMPR